MRLFVAIPIPKLIKDKLYSVINLPEEYRIVPKENLHITLAFLGETKDNFINKITNSLNTIVKNQRSFNLKINSLGQFPKKGTPNIIFFTGKEREEFLVLLSNRVREYLSKMGFTMDNKFKYHITIARKKKNLKLIKNYTLPKINIYEEFTVSKIVLFQSILKSSGALYIPIWEGNFNN